MDQHVQDSQAFLHPTSFDPQGASRMDEREERRCADDLLDFDEVHVEIAETCELHGISVEVVVGVHKLRNYLRLAIVRVLRRVLCA